MPHTVPALITASVIAAALGESHHRVRHVLATRSHITPAAKAGRTYLYRKQAIAQVRYQLTLIDARRASNAEEVQDV